jgi:hypothetical protein
MNFSRNQVRYTAILLMVLFLSEIVYPTAAFALTGGPSQPEVEAFEPAGTTEMVDPFTGDFNYNIPLLNVPGPGGGYPVNLSYHAGVGMDQEASWVGLGWNINAGVINRQVRGIPDDFNGQFIEQELSMKPDWTFAATYNKKLIKEIVGGDPNISNLEYNIYYNSYRGIGGGFSLQKQAESEKNTDRSLLGNFNRGLSYDTQRGVGLSASYSFNWSKNEREKSNGRCVEAKNRAVGVGLSLQSSNGLKTLGVTSSYSTRIPKESGEAAGMASSYGSFGSYSGTAYIPGNPFSTSGWNVGLTYTMGKELVALHLKAKDLSVQFTQNDISDNTRNAKAYGYFYDREVNLNNNEYEMRDYNRDNGQTPSKHIPSIPGALRTHDLFYIKGQGVGGVFRAYRSDHSILSDDVASGANFGASAGLELGIGGASGKFALDFTANVSDSYSGDWTKLHSSDQYESPDDLASLYHTKTNKDAPGGTNPGFEPAYFAAYGEQVGTSVAAMDALKPFKAERFGIETKWSGVSGKPEASNETFGHEDEITSERKRRGQYQGYRTLYEVYYSNSYSPEIKLNNGQTIPVKSHLVGEGGVFGSELPDPESHSIAEMYVVNTDGSRYTYGIPVYNLKEIETTFSVFPGSDIEYSELYEKPYVKYNETDYSKDNEKGEDRFFSKNTTPAYAHSYLLTAVTSADYVDLTGNGPSDDDFGSYVKFNYVLKNKTYGWRSPYAFGEPYRANFMPGYYSNEKDDKANVSYGEKELYYLESIETKTHKAVFILNHNNTEEWVGDCLVNGSRRDALGARSEHNNLDQNDTHSYYLTQIKLFRKADGMNSEELLKTIHFAYNYELCPYTENNSGMIQFTDISSGYEGNELNIGPNPPNDPTNTGKLTLKKIWTTYKKNEKGSLNPYKFDYHSGQNLESAQNPAYKPFHYDRWGNFLLDDTGFAGIEGKEHPYVRQSEDYNHNGTANEEDLNMRNANASAWTLRMINLPSGGTIQVDYESDDYSYVQDKRAMEMARLVSMTSENQEFLLQGADLTDAYGVKNKLYFEIELPNDVESADEYVSNSFKDQEYLYFKVNMRLKKKGFSKDNTGEDAYDYVEGWAKIAEDDDGNKKAGHLFSDGKNYGWVVVEPQNFRGESDADEKIHPFRRAGWQYLRVERKDLLINEIDADGWLGDLGLTVISTIKQAVSLLTGYYRSCKTFGYCNRINYNRPNYIRIGNMDGHKYGGGHRVRKITIKDNWNQVVSGDHQGEYGQEYFYTLDDGFTSSGVAEYEPLLGGEENSFRQPVTYNGNQNVMGFRNDESFLEEPKCEAYFPGANVGYSRVVVKQFREEGASSYKNSEGISEMKFYTSRDFPVDVKFTDLDFAPYNVVFGVPFIGSQSYFNNGYSMGYVVRLNDMHGKLRSTATYPYLGENIVDPVIHQNYFQTAIPVAFTEYFYRTENAFNPETKNFLSSKVDLLKSDGEVQQEYMGLSTEIINHREQNSNWSSQIGLESNLDYTGPMVIPTFYPVFNYSEGMYRAISSVKVTMQTGILERVKTYTDGNTSEVKNLLWDEATGQPLLSIVNNNYDDPVYSYSYPGHWFYNTMKGSFINEGAKFYVYENDQAYLLEGPPTNGITLSNGNLTFASQMFPPGKVAADYFEKGDELTHFPSGNRYWVTNDAVGDYQIAIVNENNIPPSSLPSGGTLDKPYFKITKSAFKNQQSVEVGSIVSLNNPVGSPTENILDVVNDFLASPDFITLNGGSIDYPYQVTTPCGSLLNIAMRHGTPGGIEIHGYDASGAEINGFIQTPIIQGVNLYQTLLNAVLTSGQNNVINGTVSNSFVNGTFAGVFTGNFDLIQQCPIAVLNASSITFSDDWSDKLRLNDAMVTQQVTHDDLINNPYRYNAKGTWRPDATYVYQIDRKQLNYGGELNKTNLRKDGLYEEFFKFDWIDPAGVVSNWTRKGEMKYYSPYGFALEDQDALGIKSAALFGFKNDLPIASAVNAGEMEIAYLSFEDVEDNTILLDGEHFGHGHLPLMHDGQASLALTQSAHTGKYAMTMPMNTYYLLKFGTSNTVSAANAASTITLPEREYYFIPECNTDGTSKKYVISGWFKASVEGGLGPIVSVNFQTGSGSGVTYNVNAVSNGSNIQTQSIEGWKKFEMYFNGPPANWNGIMKINFGGGFFTWDDIRIQPFSSEMTANIYDKNTLRLEAQLDARNFAVFYQYDEEGSLIQTKQETERGIYTIQTSRNNLKSTN